MINRVQIKNYRSIADADVELERMTILVGRNGSGKSSFVDAVKLVRDALRMGLENAIIERHGFNSIRRWAPLKKRHVEIALTVKTASFSGFYELVLGSDGEGFKILREKASYQLSRRRPRHNTRHTDEKNREYGIETIEDQFERKEARWITQPVATTDRIRPFDHALESTVLALPGLAMFGGFSILQRHLSGNFYTIFPNTLRQPQKPMTERVLNDHGDNFVSVLQHITRDNALKEEIVAVLSRVVEGVCDIRVRPAGGFLVAELQHQDLGKEGASSNGNGKSVDENAPWFDLSQESDGTLRMLGLLTALYQSPVPHEKPILALEEPEIALHPGALAILADELQAASKRRPILVTTQSPDLIARVPAANLRVVERRGGVTHISPLEETQRQVIEDQLFNAGDLLRIEGLRGAMPAER